MKIVTAAVVRNGRRVLITRRGPGDKHEGFWEFPGGKLEEGESLRECLERELLEELGVRSTVTKTICSSVYTYEHGTIKLVALETELDSMDFNLVAHDQVEWVEISRLANYKLLPADLPIAWFLQHLG